MTERDTATAKPTDWRSQLTSFLLGIASGMATNLVSGATAYRVIAVSVVLAAMLMASARLHTLPRRAPIVRYSTRLMVALGLAAAILAVAGSPSLTPYMIFGAVGMTGAAILIPTDSTVRLFMLAGVAAAGAGLSVVGLGAAILVKGGLVGGAAVVSVGVALVGIGVVVLVQGDLAREVGFVGVGVAIVGLGVVILVKGGPVEGPATLGIGTAIAGIGGLIVGLGAALLVKGGPVGVVATLSTGTAVAGVGVSAAGLGVAFLIKGDRPFGVALVGLGLGFVAIAVEIIRDDLIGAVALLSAGVILAGAGVPGMVTGDGLVKGDRLFGAAVVAAGPRFVRGF